MRAAWCLAISFVLTAIAAGGALAQPICDPELRPAAHSRYPYGPRGDLCEGLYELELSGNNELAVTGFVVQTPNWDLRNLPRVYLRWQTPSSAVRVRAQSLRWRTYYRMDAARPAAANVFTWPTLITGAEGFTQSELAVLVWLDEGVAPEQRVHLPVVMDTTRVPGPVTSYILIAVPATDFARIYVTLQRVLPDGGRQLIGTPNLDLGEVTYPKDVNVRVSISPNNTLVPGDYELQFSGVRDTGGWVHTVFRFRHAAAPL